MGQLGAAIAGELLADLGELVGDDTAQLGVVGQQLLELGDGLAELLELSWSSLAFRDG